MTKVEELFKKITDLAKEQGVKIGALEDVAGVSKGYLGRLKKEQKLPSAGALQKIAEKLGVSIDYLLEETSEGESEEELLCAKFINKVAINTRLKNIDWTYLNINLKDEKSLGAAAKELPSAFYDIVSGMYNEMLIQFQGNFEVKKVTCAKAFLPEQKITLYCYYYDTNYAETAMFIDSSITGPSEFSVYTDDENGLNQICKYDFHGSNTELGKAMGNLYRAVIHEAKLNRCVIKKMLNYIETECD